MPQAIVTKYFGPTNVRGSRVKATAQVGSVFVGWNSAFNSEANHKAAAVALAQKHGWYGRWINAGLPDGRQVWVIDHKIADSFTIGKGI